MFDRMGIAGLRLPRCWSSSLGRLRLGLVIGALLAPAAMAAQPPATAPAAKPSAPILDQSSPRALLRTFFASGGRLDEPAIRSLYHAANPVEQKTLDGVVEVEMANARLRVMENLKFGRPATRPTSPAATGIDPQLLGDIDLLTENIQGDHATVSTPKVPGLSMQFVRIDGKWKLPISSLVGKLDPQMIDSLDAVTRAQVGVIDGIAADVRDGKLTSDEQVQDELHRRLAECLAAATHYTPPTTAPTNNPPKT